jgi:hypothetical protein
VRAAGRRRQRRRLPKQRDERGNSARCSSHGGVIRVRYRYNIGDAYADEVRISRLYEQHGVCTQVNINVRRLVVALALFISCSARCDILQMLHRRHEFFDSASDARCRMKRACGSTLQLRQLQRRVPSAALFLFMQQTACTSVGCMRRQRAGAEQRAGLSSSVPAAPLIISIMA